MNLKRLVIELCLGLNSGDLSSGAKLSESFLFSILRSTLFIGRFMSVIISLNHSSSLRAVLGRSSRLDHFMGSMLWACVRSHSCKHIQRSFTFFQHTVPSVAIEYPNYILLLVSSLSIQPIFLTLLLRPWDAWNMNRQFTPDMLHQRR